MNKCLKLKIKKPVLQMLLKYAKYIKETVLKSNISV